MKKKPGFRRKSAAGCGTVIGVKPSKLIKTGPSLRYVHARDCVSWLGDIPFRRPARLSVLIRPMARLETGSRMVQANQVNLPMEENVS